MLWWSPGGRTVGSRSHGGLGGNGAQPGKQRGRMRKRARLLPAGTSPLTRDFSFRSPPPKGNQSGAPPESCLIPAEVFRRPDVRPRRGTLREPAEILAD